MEMQNDSRAYQTRIINAVTVLEQKDFRQKVDRLSYNKYCHIYEK